MRGPQASAPRRPSPAAVVGTAVVCLAAAVIPTASGAQSLAERRSLEYPVKANYLVRFAAFVHWPAQAFEAADSPIVVCVLGADPFGAALDNAAAAHPVAGRSVTVKRLVRAEARSGCHILYVGRSKEQTSEEAMKAVAGRPVLTVTDLAARRGMVHFAVVGNRVKFHIDDQQAADGGLSISSRLLSLALSVRQRR